MATLNLLLDKRRVKKDCTYPLVFRLTANRKQACIMALLVGVPSEGLSNSI
jgi:hypothetical protein